MAMNMELAILLVVAVSVLGVALVAAWRSTPDEPRSWH
jgi:hypothetical protein